MRKILFFSFLTIYISSIAQNYQFKYNNTPIVLSSEITDFYDSVYVNNLIRDNPDQLLYLNFYIQNAYTIIEVGEKSYSGEIQKLSELPRVKKKNKKINNNFTILDYDIMLKGEKQYFLIDGTTSTICLKSKTEFYKLFNEYRSNLLEK